MGKVKVEVLKPFALNTLGAITEVEEDRLAFLEGKGLVRRTGEAVDNTVSPEAETIISSLQEKLTLDKVEGEGVLDFLARISGLVESGGLVAVPASTSAFQEELKRVFGPLIATKLINNGYGNPEAVLDADTKDIEALDGVGPKTVERLVDLSANY